MKDNTTTVTYKQLFNRQKRLDKKYLFETFLLLLAPLFSTLIIVLFSMIGSFLPIILLYAILPMYYTVERRIRYSFTGVGKKDFNYKDGYREFFKERCNGIFGMISALLYSVCLGMLIYFIAQTFTPALFSAFPEANEVINSIGDLFMNNHAQQAVDFLIDNFPKLIQPMSIIISIILFLPMFLLLFYTLKENLSDHFIATLTLPDIDLNLPASQGRKLGFASFGRSLMKKRLVLNFKFNWIYMVLFTLIYASSTYLCSLINSDNLFLCTLLLLLSPTISLFFGIIFLNIALINDYTVIDLLKEDLLKGIPNDMKMSIYQTYLNPEYKHGEESKAFGCPIEKYINKNDMFKRQRDDTFEDRTPDYTRDDESVKEEETKESQAGEATFVDLSEEDKD